MRRPPPKKKRLHRLLVVVAILPVLAVVTVLTLFAFEMWTQITLGPKIESRYGFEAGAPYVTVNNQQVEVLTVIAITPGGAFDAAGIRADEIITGQTLGGLYRDLDGGTGTTNVIDIVPGGDGLPISQRPVRRVQVVAP